MTVGEKIVGEAAPEGGAGRPAEQAIDAMVAVTDAAYGSARAGQGAVADVVNRWVGRVVAAPVTVLARRDARAVLSGRIWADAALEAVEGLLLVQWACVDHLLAAHPLVGARVTGNRAWSTDGRRPVATASPGLPE